MHQHRKERRLALVMVTLVGAFILCYLPFWFGLPSQIPTLELPYGGQFWGWAILSTSVIRIAHLNYKVLLCNVCAVYCFHVSANQLDCVSQIFRPTSKQRKTTAMISQVIYSLCSGLNRKKWQEPWQESFLNYPYTKSCSPNEKIKQTYAVFELHQWKN